jgi:hypothetical protein
MRGQGSEAFERRSGLYARYDAQLHRCTRFFAAAALVNASLAKLFKMPVFRPSGCLHFLNEVGASLEIDNRKYLHELVLIMPDRHLDEALVCREQERLEYFVRLRQAWAPKQWSYIRAELNGLLNGRSTVSLLSRCSPISGRLPRMLREVRERLNCELDFADRSHRVFIGLTLIEQIRSRDGQAR